MNHNSRYRFEEMQSNNLNEKDQEPGNYHQSQSVRNLWFEMADKSAIFLNYGYLVSGEYKPQDGIIHLIFTSHIVLLIGVNLDTLFLELLDHLPRKISCVNQRYQQLTNDGQPIIENIQVLPNV
jgi:hypothetical protein